jgi:hypothetical protein
MRGQENLGVADIHRVPIPVSLLRWWAINDIELIGRVYNRRMSTEISLANKFGDTTFEDEFLAIDRHYELMAKEPGADQEVMRKRSMQDKKDLRAGVQILRGSYGIPSDPSGILVRGARAARSWQYVTSLGAQLMSAIPDITRPIITNGTLPYLKGFIKFATSNPSVARDGIKRMGIGLDIMLHNRMSVIADVNEIPTLFGKLEYYSDNLTGTFGKVSLMDPWNAFFKQLTGVMAVDRILKHGEVIATKGWAGLPKNVQEQLLWLGLDERSMNTIWRQAAKHGTMDRGFRVPNIQSWDSDWAAKMLSSAAMKESDTVIITPGKLDRPLFANSEGGKTATQFLSFLYGATNRMMISGLAQKDLNVLNSVIGGVALGIFSIWAKRSLSDQPLPESEAEWIWQGAQQSGFMGIPGEAMGASADLMGFGTYHKSVKEVLAERLVGASLSTLSNAGTVIRGAGQAAAGEQWKEHQTHAARALMPYQNVWYLRTLFDEAEEGINNVVGAEPSKSQRRGKPSGVHEMGHY